MPHTGRMYFSELHGQVVAMGGAYRPLDITLESGFLTKERRLIVTAEEQPPTITLIDDTYTSTPTGILKDTITTIARLEPSGEAGHLVVTQEELHQRRPGTPGEKPPTVWEGPATTILQGAKRYLVLTTIQNSIGLLAARQQSSLKP